MVGLLPTLQTASFSPHGARVVTGEQRLCCTYRRAPYREALGALSRALRRCHRRPLTTMRHYRHDRTVRLWDSLSSPPTRRLLTLACGRLRHQPKWERVSEARSDMLKSPLHTSLQRREH